LPDGTASDPHKHEISSYTLAVKRERDGKMKCTRRKMAREFRRLVSALGSIKKLYIHKVRVGPPREVATQRLLAAEPACCAAAMAHTPYL
jgi:hypothetical protein